MGTWCGGSLPIDDAPSPNEVNMSDEPKVETDRELLPLQA